MNIFKRILAKPEPPRTLTHRMTRTGAFKKTLTDLAVKNLDVFWKATSNEWQSKEGERDFYERPADALLVSDVENRVPHAIRVEIAGKVAGHLQHSDALRLHRRLKQLGYDRIRSKCDAQIVGRVGYWEVNLDFDDTLPAVKPALPSASG